MRPKIKWENEDEKIIREKVKIEWGDRIRIDKVMKANEIDE